MYNIESKEIQFSVVLNLVDLFNVLLEQRELKSAQSTDISRVMNHVVEQRYRSLDSLGHVLESFEQREWFGVYL